MSITRATAFALKRIAGEEGPFVPGTDAANAKSTVANPSPPEIWGIAGFGGLPYNIAEGPAAVGTG